MKRTIIIILSAAACLCSINLSAQTPAAAYEYADSVVYVPVSAVDTTLAGRDVFELLTAEETEAGATINQSQQISDSMNAHIKANGERTLSGYRVRIFFDNKQSARAESEAALNKFKKLFLDIMAYRIYVNPYFKVTVGDFRTKSEAMALLARIRYEFPSAFVLRETIEYPVVDSKNAVVADTIKVLRPKQ